jgi:CubicO group peptidase (beta-lactamase class C family)
MDILEQTIKSTYPHVFTTTIHKSGELIFEYYKRGHKGKVRTTRSITKSIISTLYGIALQKGYFKDLDEKIIPYFPEYRSAKLDEKIGQVSIRHLLSMTSGIDCSDRQPKGFFKSENWTRFYIERPVLHEPGSKFSYSSASSHLLSALLYKLTSLNVYDFAKANLFGPLGISESKWSHDKQGYYHGGFGLDLSSSSITKIGKLYLDGGTVSGNRLLPEAYIAEATTSQAQGGFPENDKYGYHWWVGSTHATNYYYAAGLGGQYLFIVPEYDLLVTITSDSRRPHIENKKIFTDVVLPEYAA